MSRLDFMPRPLAFSPASCRVVRLIACILALTLSAAVARSQSRGTQVGPGVTHRFVYDPRGPWAIHILEVDLTSPYLAIETVKAGDRLAGRERTSAMAARRDWQGHRVVGAINADFFTPNGTPISLQVSGGVIVRGPSHRTFFGITPGGRPLFRRVEFKGTVFMPDTMLAIVGVNTAHQEEGLVLYNAFSGPTTGPDSSAAIVILKPVGRVLANRPVRFVVQQIDSLSGHREPTDSTWVLAGQGRHRGLLLRGLCEGDTLRIDLLLPPLKPALKEAVGGLPRIIRDGRVSVETDIDGGKKFATQRHPRTAVGFSADSTRLWLVTVDGRQPGYSMGMTLFELAEFLLKLGVYQGVNLDGGGSTTMVVRGSVVNRPSDLQGERPVANAVLVVSRAPTGAFARLRLWPRRTVVLAGDTLRFHVSALDRFYNPVELSDRKIEWKAENRIGRVSADGRFTAAAVNDSGYVFVSTDAREGLVRDSAYVIVRTATRIVIEPDSVTLRSGERRQLRAYAVGADFTRHEIEAARVAWRVDGDIGEIRRDGFFTAADSGRGWIEAQVGHLVGRAEVSVKAGRREDGQQF